MKRTPTTTSNASRRAAAAPPDQLLSVSDAARLLGVHANTVRSWTEEGLLTCLRINGRGDRRYSRREIDRFLDRAGADRGAMPSRRATGRRIARLLACTAEASAAADDLTSALERIASVLCDEGGYRGAVLYTADGELIGLCGARPARSVARTDAHRWSSAHVGHARGREQRYRAYVPVRSERTGMLILEGTAETRTVDEMKLLDGVMAQIEVWTRVASRLRDAGTRQRRAELLVSLSSDIGLQLDPLRVLNEVVDHAAELFRADHAGVFARKPDGTFRVQVSRNLTTEFTETIEHAASLPITQLALAERRIVSVPDYPDDPRALALRPALLHEGINTLTIAPLLSEDQPLGVLALYHDRHYVWSADDLALLERLARQGATLMRNAENYSRMATWAAQLQSIQQLGSRLTRLRSVAEIGETICSELHQLIDYHNVRVYRVEGDECVPVAWRGQVGEYRGEDGEQLRMRVGEGITGWVARYGLAQNLGDAAADRRTQTIPGTDDDLEESLLLAPMLYEDEVIGVIVLAKLGLNQFSGDDLRLLEIYASIAAQAMVNADATERLREQSETLKRQVNSQRELLRVTESLLGTLDTQQLLEEIADSLKSLLHVDNICVDVHDEDAGLLRPIFARGIHAADYLAAPLPSNRGISADVIRTGDPALVQDQLSDARVAHLPSTGPLAGALIVAPLRSGERVQGLLTIERLGRNARFSDEEFELVKLFAGHVSIALRNAATHRAVELRAETDRLTGLWNHGALIEHLDRLVAAGGRFAMLMVDLDFFKRYNDRYGHQAGNAVLREVASLLRAACRDSDRIFRYGGDEFALVLPSTRLAGARTVAGKLQSAISGAALSLAADPQDAINLTCSVGIAVYPRDGHDGESIILAADRACYAGKRAGRDRVATAAEGLALAGEFEPTEPTPVLAVAGSYSAA